MGKVKEREREGHKCESQKQVINLTTGEEEALQAVNVQGEVEGSLKQCSCFVLGNRKQKSKL